MKVCQRCKTEKALELFSPDYSSSDGRRYKCRACEAQLGRMYRLKKRQAFQLKQAERLQEVLSPKSELREQNNTEKSRNAAHAAGNKPRVVPEKKSLRIVRNAAKTGTEPQEREDSRFASIVILTDIHIPQHDRRFWRAALKWIEENKPDEIILNGDFGEYESVSQHGGANEAKLLDDIVEVKQALDELRAAGGEDCKITYLEGNHESRLPRAVASWAPTFTNALDLQGMLGLEERGIEWVPEYSQPVQRGLLRVLHGHQVLGKYGPRNHAAKAADVYGSSTFSEVVYGHVHAAQNFTKPVIGGYVSATALGCGRTIGSDQVRWLAGRESGWHHGFGVAYIADSFVSVYPVKVRDGRFVWNGRMYDGRETNTAPKAATRLRR